MRGSFLLLPTGAVAAGLIVQVGDPVNGNVFQPRTLRAEQGDLIVFIISALHSVTQANDISSPRRPLRGGFDVEGAQGAHTTFQYLVGDTDPVYIYCMPHCSSDGMVMIINPRQDSDIDTFMSIATGGSPEIPPEPPSSPTVPPSTAQPKTPSPSTTATNPSRTSTPDGTATGTVSTSQSTAAPTAEQSKSSNVPIASLSTASADSPGTTAPSLHRSLGSRQIAGIAAAAAAVLFIAFAFMTRCVLRRRARDRPLVTVYNPGVAHAGAQVDDHRTAKEQSSPPQLEEPEREVVRLRETVAILQARLHDVEQDGTSATLPMYESLSDTRGSR